MIQYLRGARPGPDAEMKPETYPPDPNVFLTEKCGRACLFCSARGEDRAMTTAQVRAVLRRAHPALVFEGGEPLLAPGLENWVRAARLTGTTDITLLTNGLLLTPERRRTLVRAGVNHFHFNFPSHLPAAHDALTGTKGRLGAQLTAIKEAAASGPEAAALVCVVTSLNFRHLPAYVSFAAREFPGLHYIAFNLVKFKGAVRKRPDLVPDLREAGPRLLAALRRARKLGLPCLVDGVPLCFLRGFEAYSRDADKLLRGDRTYLREKKPVKACANCGLSSLCPGPRADYAALRGERGFRAAPPGAAIAVTRLLRRGQLTLNARPESPRKRR